MNRPDAKLQEEKRQDMSPRGRILFGLIFVLIGLPFLLIGLNVLRPDPSGIHAPLWVIACCGLVFMLAGATIAVSAASPTLERDGSLPASAPWSLRFAQYGIGVCIVALLATIGSWVAVGTGERKFTATTTTLGAATAGPGNETVGRIVFGIGAALCWLFVIFVARHGWRKLNDGNKPPPG